jgi:hypothetical protein
MLYSELQYNTELGIHLAAGTIYCPEAQVILFVMCLFRVFGYLWDNYINEEVYHHITYDS